MKVIQKRVVHPKFDIYVCLIIDEISAKHILIQLNITNQSMF